MRICFVCGSTKACQHREIDLLPPAIRRYRERQMISAESTAISTGEIAEVDAKAMQYHYDMAANREHLLKTPRKSMTKAVDACGENLHTRVIKKA